VKRKIQREINEFQFYASDKLLIQLNDLDATYIEYFKILTNQVFSLFQEVFDIIIIGDITGLYSFIKNSQISIQQLSKNQNIYELLCKIKD